MANLAKFRLFLAQHLHLFKIHVGLQNLLFVFNVTLFDFLNVINHKQQRNIHHKTDRQHTEHHCLKPGQAMHYVGVVQIELRENLVRDKTDYRAGKMRDRENIKQDRAPRLYRFKRGFFLHQPDHQRKNKRERKNKQRVRQQIKQQHLILRQAHHTCTDELLRQDGIDKRSAHLRAFRQQACQNFVQDFSLVHQAHDPREQSDIHRRKEKFIFRHSAGKNRQPHAGNQHAAAHHSRKRYKRVAPVTQHAMRDIVHNQRPGQMKDPCIRKKFCHIYYNQRFISFLSVKHH